MDFTVTLKSAWSQLIILLWYRDALNTTVVDVSVKWLEFVPLYLLFLFLKHLFFWCALLLESRLKHHPLFSLYIQHRSYYSLCLCTEILNRPATRCVHTPATINGWQSDLINASPIMANFSSVSPKSLCPINVIMVLINRVNNFVKISTVHL